MEFKPVPHDRQTLYDEVWSRPVREVAKDFGLSDRGLALLCRRHKVPVPPRGYWAKKLAGQPVQHPRLPKEKDASSPLPAVDEQTRAEARKRREILDASAKAAPQVAPAAELTDPHPLIEAAAKTLRASGTDDNGFLTPRSAGRLAIRTTPATLDRALRIMDAVVKALEQQALPIHVKTDDSGKSVTYVLIEEEQVEFELTEETTAVERPLTKAQMLDKLKNPWKYGRPEYDRVPNGRLTFSITNPGYRYGVRSKFGDGTTARLDRHLHTVVAGLIAAGKKKHAERLEDEQREREREEVARRAAAERRRQEREDRRWELLRRDLGEWQLAEELRAYVAARRAYLATSGEEVGEETAIGRYLRWVAEAADRIDPARSQSPPRERRSYSWEAEPEDEW